MTKQVHAGAPGSVWLRVRQTHRNRTRRGRTGRGSRDCRRSDHVPGDRPRTPQNRAQPAPWPMCRTVCAVLRESVRQHDDRLRIVLRQPRLATQRQFADTSAGKFSLTHRTSLFCRCFCWLFPQGSVDTQFFGFLRRADAPSVARDARFQAETVSPKCASALDATISPHSCTKCPASDNSSGGGQLRIVRASACMVFGPSTGSCMPIAMKLSPCHSLRKNSAARREISAPSIEGRLERVPGNVARRRDRLHRETARRTAAPDSVKCEHERCSNAEIEKSGLLAT